MNINRRSLFKTIVMAVGVILTPKIWQTSVAKKPVITKKELTDKEKYAIIEKMLDTKEGREELRKAMIEPLRGPVEYIRRQL